MEARRLLANISPIATLPTGAAGGMVIDAQGDIFGATSAGLYEVPAGQTQAENIPLGASGAPAANLTIDAEGDVFGDVPSAGVIFEIPAGGGFAQAIGSSSSSLGNGVARDLAGDIFVLVPAASSTDSTTGTSTTTSATILELPAGGDESDQGSAFSTLATFASGDSPTGELAIDAAGDIFAVSATGGANSDGAIFELPANNRSSIIQIASFGPTNPLPQGDIIGDAAGDLFGTTYDALNSQQSLSTVFELSAGSSDINTLYTDSSFTGSRIEAGLARDTAGDLFGAITESTTSATLFKIPANQRNADTLGNFSQINGYPAIGPNNWLYASTTKSLYALPNATSSKIVGRLALTTAATSTAASATLSSITISVVDTNDNVITADNGPITVQIAKGPDADALSGTLTVNATSGSVTFSDLSINTPGNYKLAFSQSGIKKTLLVPVHITRPASNSNGSHLVITQSPATVVAGEKISPIVVAAENSDGTVSAITKAKVSLLIGSVTKTANLQNGIAKFRGFAVDQAGDYSIQATAPTSTASPIVSLTIAPAASKKLLFSEQPAAIVGTGATLAVEVTLCDRFGNAETGDNSAITIDLQTNQPSLLLLTGTLTQYLSDGVADFNNLAVNKSGNYRLIATDAAGNFRAISDPFTVTSNIPPP